MKEIFNKLNQCLNTLNNIEEGEVSPTITDRELSNIQKTLLDIYEELGMDDIDTVKQLIIYNTTTQYRLIISDLLDMEEDLSN